MKFYVWKRNEIEPLEESEIISLWKKGTLKGTDLVRTEESVEGYFNEEWTLLARTLSLPSSNKILRSKKLQRLKEDLVRLNRDHYFSERRPVPEFKVMAMKCKTQRCEHVFRFRSYSLNTFFQRKNNVIISFECTKGHSHEYTRDDLFDTGERECFDDVSMRKFANYIAEQLGKHNSCAIPEPVLSEIWPQTHQNKRKEKIKRFARAHGLAVTFYGLGLRAVFKTNVQALQAHYEKLRQQEDYYTRIVQDGVPDSLKEFYPKALNDVRHDKDQVGKQLEYARCRNRYSA